MRQQPPGTSRFSYQPLQLRERGYGEEEIELALVPLILEFVSQRLEVLEVRLNKQTTTKLPIRIDLIYPNNAMHHMDGTGPDPTLANLSRWQDSLAMTEYFLRAHLFGQRISDEVRSAGMQVMGSANLSKIIVSGDHDVKNPVTTLASHDSPSARGFVGNTR